MRRTLGIVGVVATLLLVAGAWRTNMPNRNPALQGAWTVTSWEVEGESVTAPQPGLILFTETHYTMMYVNGAQPRPWYDGGIHHVHGQLRAVRSERERTHHEGIRGEVPELHG